MSARGTQSRGVARALDEAQSRRLVDLLRRELAAQRAAQRAPARVLPPAPTPHDRALYDAATSEELARVDVLLKRAGFVEEDLSRGRAALRAASSQAIVTHESVDAVTRARARALRKASR